MEQGVALCFLSLAQVAIFLTPAYWSWSTASVGIFRSQFAAPLHKHQKQSLEPRFEPNVERGL